MVHGALRDYDFDLLEPMFAVKLAPNDDDVRSLCPDTIVDMYNRAFFVPSGVTALYGLPNALKAETTSILYFNFGLAYHRKALAESGNRFLLEAALQLYTASSFLLRTTEGLSLRTVHLSLALATNTCHIHSFLWRMDDLDRSLSEGSAVLSFLSSTELTVCCVSEEEHHFFAANFVLGKANISPAA